MRRTEEEDSHGNEEQSEAKVAANNLIFFIALRAPSCRKKNLKIPLDNLATSL
jgi:hypothetical protein